MDFHSMKRKELQELCKTHGIPANLSNAEMVNRLSSSLKEIEEEKPLTRGRSCLKAVEQDASHIDSDAVNRKAKKVRFSPENELIEFTKSNGKRGRGSKSGVRNSLSTVGSVSSVEQNQTEVKSSPIRATRSRGVQLLDDGDDEKVIKRGLNGNDRVDKLPLVDNEVRVTTRRAVHKREMQDEGFSESEAVTQGTRKSKRKRNQGSDNETVDVPKSKQNIEEPKDTLKRSTRNAAKKENTGLVNEDVGKTKKHDVGRQRRNQVPSEVDDSVVECDEVRSVENDANMVTGVDKKVAVTTRRTLRNREVTVEQKIERAPLEVEDPVVEFDEVKSVENDANMVTGGDKKVEVATRRTLRNRQITVEQKIEREPLEAEDPQFGEVRSVENDANMVTGGDKKVEVSTRRTLRNRQITVEQKIEREPLEVEDPQFGEVRSVENDANMVTGGDKKDGVTTRKTRRNRQITVERKIEREPLEVDDPLVEFDEVRSVENDANTVTGGDKMVGVTNRRTLRNKEITVEQKIEREDGNAGLRRSGRQSKGGPLVSNEVLQSQDIVEEPKQKLLKRSKRNVSPEKDTGTLDENKNIGKVRLGRKQITLAVKTSKLESAATKTPQDSSASPIVSSGEKRAHTKRSLRNKKVGVSVGRKHITLAVKTSKLESAAAKTPEDSSAATSVSSGEKRAHTKRSLKNKKVGVSVVVDEGLMKMGGQVSKRNVKSHEEGPQNEQIGEEVNIAPKRSKRNASKMDDSQYLHTGIGKRKMVRKEQKTRSQSSVGGEASVTGDETEMAELEKNELGKDPSKPHEEGPQNEQIGEEVNKAPKRSKRNASKMDDSQHLSLGVDKSKMVRKEQKRTSQSSVRGEASVPGDETEMADLEKNEVGKEPAKSPSSSPQNSVLPFLEKATKETDASSHGAHSEIENEADGGWKMLAQVEEPSTASPRLRTETAAESGLEVVDQDKNQTSPSPCKIGAISELTDNYSKSFEEHEDSVAEDMGTSRRSPGHDHVNLSDGSGIVHNATLNPALEKESCDKITTVEISSEELRADATRDDKFVELVGNEQDAENKRPASPESGIVQDDATVNPAVEKESSDKKSTPVEISLEQLRADPTRDDKIVQPVGNEQDVGIKRQISPESIFHESCLGKNESEEKASHKKNQVSSLEFGDRAGEAEKVKTPHFVGEFENSCSDLVDLHTDSGVRKVEMVEVNVKNTLDESAVANFAEQEPSEHFNVDRDSASVEATSRVDCYRTSGQSSLTGGVKELLSKELAEIEHAESRSKEVISSENELGLVAVQLNKIDGENLATEVSLTEDGMSIEKKKLLQHGDCSQVKDIIYETFNLESFTDNTAMTGSKFEESAQQNKQASSPKVGSRKKMEDVQSPQLMNAIEESCSELVTSHSDHVDQQKVIDDELKGSSDMAPIPLEENTEKSLGGLVDEHLVYCRTFDGINVDRDTVPSEINSPTTNTVGCINQSDLTADVKEKHSEGVTDLQHAGYLGIDTGSIFHVEQPVKDEQELSTTAAETVNSFATVIESDDLPQHSLDDRPGENLEDGSIRFEEAGENLDDRPGENLEDGSKRFEEAGENPDDRPGEILEDGSIRVEEAGENLDHRSGENLEDGSIRFEEAGQNLDDRPLENLEDVSEEAGFVDSSEKHEHDASIHKDHAVNASSLENTDAISLSTTQHLSPLLDIEPANTVDWKKSPERGEQLSSKLNIEFAFVASDAVPSEINSPANALGCTDQSDLTADVEVKHSEEVTELQYTGSLSKDTGSTFQVEQEVEDDLELATIAAESVNSFATVMVSNDLPHDSLDDRPGENLEDSSIIFEEAGFVDSSEKNEYDFSKLEDHTVDAGNMENSDAVYLSTAEQFTPVIDKEPNNSVDWKKSPELGEQLSSKHKNNIEFAVVARDAVPSEINSPTNALGGIDQMDLTADVNEKHGEGVEELSLTKDTGTTFQVEQAVEDEQELATIATENVNSFATVTVSNDLPHDCLDYIPRENIQDGSIRFEESGFVDSSEKHEYDTCILEVHTVDARNLENTDAVSLSTIEQFSPVLDKEPTNTLDWRKSPELEEQNAVPSEINSPSNALGCINQLDLTADVNEKYSEGVSELQYAGSLSKDTGSTFQVEKEVEDEQELATIALEGANSFGTVIVANDLPQDCLDDRENLEYESIRFEESGFVDSSEKHEYDVSILEDHAVDAQNLENTDERENLEYDSIRFEESDFVDSSEKHEYEASILEDHAVDAQKLENTDDRVTLEYDSIRFEESGFVDSSDKHENEVSILEDHAVDAQNLENTDDRENHEYDSIRFEESGFVDSSEKHEYDASILEDHAADSQNLENTDDRENHEYGSIRFEESSSEKHEYDASILEDHAVDSQNLENTDSVYLSTTEQYSPIIDKEPTITVDWKKSPELGEQSSSKGQLADNDENPSEYDAAERRSETGVQVVTDNNGEEVPAILENTASHGTPEYRNEEDQEYQLRLLFSTPTIVRGTGEEKCKALDSNISSHLAESSNTVHTVLDDNTIALNNDMESEQDVRELFTTNDDLCTDGKDKSSPNGDSDTMETDIPPSEYEGILNEVECGKAIPVQDTSDCDSPLKLGDNKKEDQPILLDSDTSDHLIEAPKTGYAFTDADCAQGSSDCATPLKSDVEKKESPPHTISTPTSVGGTDEDGAEDLHTNSNQRSEQLVEASNAVQTVDDTLWHMLAVKSGEEHVDEVQESDLSGNIGTKREEISNFAEPLGTQGNSPCVLATPFKEECEDAKDKFSDSEGSYNCSENAITNPEVGDCPEESCEVESLISTEAVVASDGGFHGDISQDLNICSPVEDRIVEDHPLKNTTEQPEAESATLSSPKFNFGLGGNTEEAQVLHVESTITTSTCKYIVEDEGMKGSPAAMVVNANSVASSSIFFSSPSKLHAIFEELDKSTPKPTSANEDSPGTITNIGQPLTVAEMNQAGSCQLVELEDSKSRYALPVYESPEHPSTEEFRSPAREAEMVEPEEVLPVYESPEQPATEELGCRTKQAQMELHTVEPHLGPTHEPSEEIDSDVDKGLVEDASFCPGKNVSIEKPFSTELNSLSRNNDTRSILIHATPFKQPVRGDMKENDPVSKRELAGSLTAARTEKRRPLKDL